MPDEMRCAQVNGSFWLRSEMLAAYAGNETDYHNWAGLCVRECVCERERVCMFVCERERVCVCLCVCVRERDCVYVCVRER